MRAVFFEKYVAFYYKALFFVKAHGVDLGGQAEGWYTCGAGLLFDFVEYELAIMMATICFNYGNPTDNPCACRFVGEVAARSDGLLGIAIENQVRRCLVLGIEFICKALFCHEDLGTDVAGRGW